MQGCIMILKLSLTRPRLVMQGCIMILAQDSKLTEQRTMQGSEYVTAEMSAIGMNLRYPGMLILMNQVSLAIAYHLL